MSLSHRITAELKEAIKTKDAIRASCMRMLKADLKNRQVEKGSDLEDKEIESVVSPTGGGVRLDPGPIGR